MGQTPVELSILDNEDAEPRCATVPCDGVATLGEFRALLENGPIRWPFDFYDAKRKRRIATEFEQISRLELYNHEVTIIPAMVKERERVAEARLEPTTVEEVIPPPATVSAACDDEYEEARSKHVAYKGEREEAKSEPAAYKHEREEAMSEPAAYNDEREEASCSKPNPKHKVFLSHSGNEKSFVRKLCKLLEQHDHYPFFDQREDILKSGEKFAGPIIDAARKCEVGVVVLSEGYLRSRWPMIELAEFVHARKSRNENMNLLPLFYKVSVADLDDASIKEKWMPEWEKIVGVDPRVDLKAWVEAIQELRRWKGLVYDKFKKKNISACEAKESYRDAIVETIFKLAPPDLLYDMSKIHGGDRICKILADKFKQHHEKSALVLGLYGMGGLGKTTISKFLCNHFNEEFLGRVCYIEMRDRKDALMRQKTVMRKLLRLGEPMMLNIGDDSEGWNILRGRMKEKPVFLVIDDVGPDNEEEARDYLDIEYNSQSKIMVISRSLDIVERLLGHRRYCSKIPSLNGKEAIGVLLQQGGRNLSYPSLSKKERGIAEGCVKEAYFENHDFKQITSSCKNGGGHYHPLALRALGAYMQKKNKTYGVLSWDMNLNEYRELKGSGVPHEKQIFMILGLQFSALGEMEKLMYLDIVLYSQSALEAPMLSNSRREDMEIWLANIHNVEIAAVKEWISCFSELALLNIEKEDIIVHDLYKDYAKWALKNFGDSVEPIGVWCVKSSDEFWASPFELEKLPPGICSQKLRRIRVKYHSFQGFPVTKFQEWQNVVVLQISFCDVTTLNFQVLTCLRHLELHQLKYLETLILRGNEKPKQYFRAWLQYVVGNEEPKQYFHTWLQYVVLRSLPLLKFLPSFRQFTSLVYLEVEACKELREPPMVQYCTSLKRMNLDWCIKQKTLPNLNGLKSLQDLTIWGPQFSTKGEALKLEGLSSLSSLRALELKDIPVRDLNGLENLTNVDFIILSRLYKLESLPPLERLANSSLHELYVDECGEHKEKVESIISLIRQKRERLEAEGKFVPKFSSSKIRLRRIPIYKLRRISRISSSLASLAH